MHDLQLVGFTTDRRGLIFRTATGAPGDSFVVPLTPELVAVVGELAAEAPELPDVEAAPPAGTAEPAPAEDAARPRSLLSVRDIQARLRAGEPVAQVAREAGVDDEWIERFAPPVRAEQQRIVERALDAHLQRARGAPSALPLRRAVGLAMAERGVAFTVAAFEAAWTARLLGHDRWAVDFAYRHRGPRTARWIYDAAAGELTSADRTAAQLGYVPEGARRAADAAEEVDGLVGDPHAAAPITTEAEAPPPAARRRRGTGGAARRAAVAEAEETSPVARSRSRARSGATKGAAQVRTKAATRAGGGKAGATRAASTKAAAKASTRKATGTTAEKARVKRAATKKSSAPATKKAASAATKKAAAKASTPKATGATAELARVKGAATKKASGARTAAGKAGAPRVAANKAAPAPAGEGKGTATRPAAKGNGTATRPAPAKKAAPTGGGTAKAGADRAVTAEAAATLATVTGAAASQVAPGRAGASTRAPERSARAASTAAGSSNGTVREPSAASNGTTRPTAATPGARVAGGVPAASRTQPAPPADGRPVAARPGAVDLGEVALAPAPPARAPRPAAPDRAPAGPDAATGDDAGWAAPLDRTDARRARAAERSAATVQFRSGSAVPVRQGDRVGGPTRRRRQLRAR